MINKKVVLQEAKAQVSRTYIDQCITFPLYLSKLLIYAQKVMYKECETMIVNSCYGDK